MRGLVVAFALLLTSASIAHSEPFHRGEGRWSGGYLGAAAATIGNDYTFKNDGFRGFSQYVPGIDEVISAAYPKNVGRTKNSLGVGFTGGYNYQSGAFVGGLEGDIFLSGGRGVSDSFLGAPPSSTTRVSLRAKNDWLASVRLRGGISLDRLFLYGTAGVSMGAPTYQLRVSQEGFGDTHDARVKDLRAGWIAGIGAEYAINERWSLKTEYLRYDLGKTSVRATPTPLVPPGTTVNYQFRSAGQIARMGLNFKF